MSDFIKTVKIAPNKFINRGLLTMAKPTSVTAKNTLILTAAITAALLSSMPVQALEKGDILARARIINIHPNVNNGNRLSDHDTGQRIDAGVKVDTQATLDLDFTYMVTNHVGLELLLDTTSKHTIRSSRALNDVKIGDVRVLPPSLIAQYHFLPNKSYRPYAGAGINYTFYFDENTHKEWDAALGGKTKLSVKDTWGYVAQVGMDIDIVDGWFFNMDIKYIGMNTKAVVKVDGVKSFDANFDVNPMVYGVGIGTTF
jgi:outer membrane protein